jgi:hypothetical protein
MVRTRLAATLLVLGVIGLGLACEFAVPNGQYCTKDRDCQSGHCIQQVCGELGASSQQGTTDAGPTDTGSGQTTSETSAEAAAD